MADVLKRERKRYPGASVPDFAKVNDMPQDGKIDDVLRVQLFYREHGEEWPDVHVAWNEALTGSRTVCGSADLDFTPSRFLSDADDALRKSHIKGQAISLLSETEGLPWVSSPH